MCPNQENIYWLFSSSAQTISAFVAFLVTGFAIVLNIMDNIQQKDDTLEDILTKLKSKYYNRLVFLLIITGLAIVFSLWMVYLNGGKSLHKIWLYPLTIIINVTAITVGIIFVISIINPGRYKKAAKEIIKEDKFEDSSKKNEIDQITFMTEFIKLEKSIRDILIKKKLYIPYGETPKMAYSFRQMANALLQNELLDRQDIDDMLKINKYRNLVFHGHQAKVDKKMLERVRAAQKKIDGIRTNNGSA